eukprot:1140869-Pelagomonas_calceolata.AAC.4
MLHDNKQEGRPNNGLDPSSPSAHTVHFYEHVQTSLLMTGREPARTSASVSSGGSVGPEGTEHSTEALSVYTEFHKYASRTATGMPRALSPRSVPMPAVGCET